MKKFKELENRSIHLIREAYSRFSNIALLWSMGKDSTTLLWLCRKAFLGKFPFPVLHIDTSYKFKEIYDFRNEYAKKWDLDLIVAQNEKALADGMNCENKLECCNELKTNALKQAISQYNFDALIVGIRRDEHGVRAKERYFSPRNKQLKWDYENQPPEIWDQFEFDCDEDEHYRIHPLLHWSEKDIWQYTAQEKIPFVPLYTATNGQRYRSIGCECCCNPIASEARTVEEIITELETTRKSERGGRAQDKEDVNTMQKLRALGYM